MYYIKEFLQNNNNHQKQTISRVDFNNLYQEEEKLKIIMGSNKKLLCKIFNGKVYEIDHDCDILFFGKYLYKYEYSYNG